MDHDTLSTGTMATAIDATNSNSNSKKDSASSKLSSSEAMAPFSFNRIMENTNGEFDSVDVSKVGAVKTALEDKDIVITGGGYTAEAFEIDRKTRLLEQLKLARKLRAKFERACEDVDNEDCNKDNIPEASKASASKASASKAPASTSNHLNAQKQNKRNRQIRAQNIFIEHIEDMNQLVSLTEAVLGNYTVGPATSSSSDHYTHTRNYSNMESIPGMETKTINESTKAQRIQNQHYQEYNEQMTKREQDERNKLSREDQIIKSTVKNLAWECNERDRKINNVEESDKKRKANHPISPNKKPTKMSKASTKYEARKHALGTSNLSAEPSLLSSVDPSPIPPHVLAAAVEKASKYMDEADVEIDLPKKSTRSRPLLPTRSNIDHTPSPPTKPASATPTGTTSRLRSSKQKQQLPLQRYQPQSQSKKSPNNTNKNNTKKKNKNKNNTSTSKKSCKKVIERKCHQCKKMTTSFRKCQYLLSSGSKCRKNYCQDCLESLYDVADFGNKSVEKEWHCFSCIGCCKCEVCMKEQERLLVRYQKPRRSSAAR